MSKRIFETFSLGKKFELGKFGEIKPAQTHNIHAKWSEIMTDSWKGKGCWIWKQENKSD